jgi:hypothetical protein
MKFSEYLAEAMSRREMLAKAAGISALVGLPVAGGIGLAKMLPDSPQDTDLRKEIEKILGAKAEADPRVDAIVELIHKREKNNQLPSQVVHREPDWFQH